MKTVLMNAQKGGVGKTYIALSLATQAARAGLRTLVIDLDEQETISKLIGLRGDDLPSPVTLDENPKPAQLGTVLEALKDQFDLCLIDTPGAVQPWTVDVMKQANLVLIPTGTSTPDLMSIDRTQALANGLSVPFAFILSLVDTRGGRADEVAQGLGKYGTVCASRIKYRSLHKQATDAGRTALDSTKSGDKAGREELAALWEEVRRLANV